MLQRSLLLLILSFHVCAKDKHSEHPTDGSTTHATPPTGRSTTGLPATTSMQTKKVPSSSDVMMGEYRKVKSLGSGVAGVVFEVEKDGKRFALKKTKNRWDQGLKEEFDVLKKLDSEKGFPRAHSLFKCDGRDCMVMELVGPVVSNLQRDVARFPDETVGSIGIQLVDRIESMHKHGLTHGDLYRNNISPGRGESKHTVFAIDFGQVRTSRPKKFDVKSVLCTIVGLLRISENCSHHADYRKDRAMLKKSPGPVSDLIKYVETLDSDSKIDYDRMRSYMERLIREAGREYKGEVIWPKEIIKSLEKY